MINGHRLGGLIGEREQHIMEREKERERERERKREQKEMVMMKVLFTGRRY